MNNKELNNVLQVDRLEKVQNSSVILFKADKNALLERAAKYRKQQTVAESIKTESKFVHQAKIMSNENTLVKVYNSDAGLIAWDAENKTVDIDGSVWTEEEILRWHRTGKKLDETHLHLRRLFPNAKLKSIKKYED